MVVSGYIKDPLNKYEEVTVTTTHDITLLITIHVKRFQGLLYCFNHLVNITITILRHKLLFNLFTWIQWFQTILSVNEKHEWIDEPRNVSIFRNLCTYWKGQSDRAQETLPTFKSDTAQYKDMIKPTRIRVKLKNLNSNLSNLLLFLLKWRNITRLQNRWWAELNKVNTWKNEL